MQRYGAPDHSRADALAIRLDKRQRDVPSNDLVSDEAHGLGREYFTRLDLRFNPGLRPMDHKSVARLTALRDLLKNRLFLRRDLAVAQESEDELPTSDRLGVQRISSELLELLRSVFGTDLCEQAVLDRVGRAHDLFSTGCLRRQHDPRIRVPNNVPDGAAIFLYAEFALLAIDLEVDTEVWCNLLPILVRMPALYVRVHQAHRLERCRLPRPFDEFGEPPAVPMHISELELWFDQVRRQLLHLSVSQLARKLAVITARALCGPTQIQPHASSATG